MIRTTAARIHPWLAGLFALGVLLQAFLAGAAASARRLGRLRGASRRRLHGDGDPAPSPC
jgi:hypothetical protein